MNKIQMIDTAEQLISITEDIKDNLEDVDFAEVRELLEKLRFWQQQLSQAIGSKRHTILPIHKKQVEE